MNTKTALYKKVPNGEPYIICDSAGMELNFIVSKGKIRFFPTCNELRKFVKKFTKIDHEDKEPFIICDSAGYQVNFIVSKGKIKFFPTHKELRKFQLIERTGKEAIKPGIRWTRRLGVEL